MEEAQRALDNVMLKRDDGILIIPELYAVPHDMVEQEKKSPRTVERHAAGKVRGVEREREERVGCGVGCEGKEAVDGWGTE